LRRDPSGGAWHIDTKPHLGRWQVDIDSDILMPMIDCMLGGGREPAAPIRRPLTEIETRLGERVVRILLAALKASWQEVTTLPLEMAPISSTVTNAPAAAAIGVGFELEMAAARGTMHLSIPLPTVALLLGQRNTSLPAGSAGEATSQGTVELVASLGETQIEPEELAQLAVGDIIATEQASAEPIVVSHDGVVKFEARLGASQGRKALEIERAVPAPRPSGEP
jgi:flagellar motor switch protein FliM